MLRRRSECYGAHDQCDGYSAGAIEIEIGSGIEKWNRKTELDRMATLLSRLGGRGYQVREEATAYDGNPIDPDIDSDLEGEKTFGMGLQRNA